MREVYTHVVELIGVEFISRRELHMKMSSKFEGRPDLRQEVTSCVGSLVKAGRVKDVRKKVGSMDLYGYVRVVRSPTCSGTLPEGSTQGTP